MRRSSVCECWGRSRVALPKFAGTAALEQGAYHEFTDAFALTAYLGRVASKAIAIKTAG